MLPSAHKLHRIRVYERTAMRSISTAVFVIVLGLIAAAQVGKTKSGAEKASARTVPVTTASAQARELFEKGMVDYENLHLDRATQQWRDAAKADPDFALANAWVAFTSTNPAEADTYRE